MIPDAVFIFILLVIGLASATDIPSDLKVTTNIGKVLGKRLTVVARGAPNRQVDAFLGIPYAEPPLRELRFRPPVPKRAFNHTFNATYYGYGCDHIPDMTFPGFQGSEMWNSPVRLHEDCLNLNVWTPYPRPQAATVMIWIYGGSFLSGVSSLELYDGQYLAAEQNVVVVSMNYRLGALGFLAMDHESSPGNQGLMDQKVAMQWVQDNIHQFGGDPNQVTIFGESAGAASVALHMLSPVSRTLFQRAIMQSSAATAPWATVTNDEGLRRGKLLAKELECSEYSNGTELTIPLMIDCIRTREVTQILAKQYAVTNGFCEFQFPPVVDGTFITETPRTSLERHSFKPGEILLGSNLNEANFFLIYEVPGFDKDHESLLNRDEYYDALQYVFPRVNSFGLDATAFQYTDWLAPNDPVKLRDGVDFAAGDYLFTCSTYDLAYAYASAGNKVYYYRFLERDSTHPWPEWMGVLHGDEILYVFGMPLVAQRNYTDIEVTLSRKIMTYWANFAKTGNPNKMTESDPDSNEWPMYNTNKQRYLELTEDLANNNPSLGRGPRADKCAFWRDYLPTLETQTGDIRETEIKWKEEFTKWYTKHMVNWKAEFARYINNKNEQCDGR
ncbi:acetylcholinesterase-like [Lytechinus variegatus]|uniref:acetylcholinesterase-like n=1 Tax=Lytechinus variegatus TaxID=7654 RepID=UPI001BB25077|nr:acetylcholinesterase-like [Lytechinus variegatus]XP_041482623.1 acetylcholinesterase-like [Lytechinus variegatus]